MPSVVCALLRGQEAPCSAGTQLRDFLHAADVASRMLREAGVPHALAGGLAVGAYGYPRTTDAVRFLANRICPVAQNVHVNGQPDCEERQSDRRPSR